MRVWEGGEGEGECEGWWWGRLWQVGAYKACYWSVCGLENHAQHKHK